MEIRPHICQQDSLDQFGHSPTLALAFKTARWFQHAHCDPDVVPRLTSGGYEHKVHVITPINIYCS